MAIKRPDKRSDKDVFIENTSSNETNKKRRRSGNRTTGKNNRVVCAHDNDMKFESIKTTAAGRFMSKAYNYALPAAAVAVFAAVISSSARIGESLDSYISGSGADPRMIAGELSAGPDDTVTADELVFDQKKVVFEDPVQALGNILDSESMAYVEAIAVYADEEFLGAVMETDSIEKYLDERLEKVRSEPGVKDACYKKKITYRNSLFSPQNISDSSKVISYFENEITEQYYTIEEGDSLYLIAEDHGMSFDDLMAINPEIEDPDLCFVGSTIRVSCHIESMPVLITRQTEETVSVPFDTMTVESDSLFCGESEMLVSGVNGESVNTLNVVYEGTNEVSREIVSTRIVTEPVAEMIAVGTKTRQTVASPGSDDIVLNGTGKFMWPVNGGWISDPFGSDRYHKGLDIAAGEGTEIYAAADGKVVAAGWNTGGYGYFVMIDHGEGYVTLYAHMSKVIASNGAEVKCGDLIGEVGTTGDSTGNHLHFEVRYQNVCQNPALYLKVNSDAAEEKAVTEQEIIVHDDPDDCDVNDDYDYDEYDNEYDYDY